MGPDPVASALECTYTMPLQSVSVPLVLKSACTIGTILNCRRCSPSFEWYTSTYKNIHLRGSFRVVLGWNEIVVVVAAPRSSFIVDVGIVSRMLSSPNKYRPRKDGLPQNIQRQLLIDIEGSGKGQTCGQICDKRPQFYGLKGSDLRRRVQNKHQNYKDLKKRDPSEYW
jgi:hypothetical protein